MEKNVKIVQVSGSGGQDRYLSGFTRVFKAAFSGPPYYEKFLDEEVAGILRELVNWDGGYCSVLVNGQGVVGLSGGFQLKSESEISQLAQKYLEVPSSAKIFYLAELAVDSDYRHHGYGSMLVEAMIKHLREKTDFEQVLVRTQKEGSNAVNIFKRLGMEIVSGMIQDVETYVGQDGDRKKVVQERIFLNLKL